MKIKGLIDEDFTNYKKPSMFVITPYCDGKCNKGYDTPICQNYNLMKDRSDLMEIDTYELVKKCYDDVVIYTGFTEEELQYDHFFNSLKDFENIIVKFGRFVPNDEPHYDEILGVKLASLNQYAKKIN